MKEKLNNVLIKSILETLIFLEFSDDKVLDPDASIEMMETIASNLQDLGDKEKKDLFLEFSKMSTYYPLQQKEFIQDLSNSLGLES